MPEPKWSGRNPTPGGDGGGPSSLTDLTDVTGTPGPNKSPVYDGDTGLAPLTEVPTQADLDAILLSRPWHKVRELADPWQPSNPTAVLTPDGIAFGPYADGHAAGGSIRYHGLNGQPMSAVRNLAFNIRYIEEGMHQEVSPYLRIFTQDAQGTAHDAIYSPGSQFYPGLGCGPSQEFVATSGTWRYDDDAGSGGIPYTELLDLYGDHVITKLGITVGFTNGVNLTGLLRWWEINSSFYIFTAA